MSATDPSTEASARLPAATQLRGVRLQVSSLARSVAWYTTTLGFHVLEQTVAEARLGTRSSTATLVTLVERAGTQPLMPHSRLGLYHFAILLPSRAALGHCLQHLLDLHAPVAHADHWVSEALYLHDPDGLGIEVYADRPRAEWPRENNRLRMATIRLDVRALLASAPLEPWTGLPHGTVMGHIHLHVGDIDAGDAFYRAGLGLDETFRMPGALFLSAGGYHHHVGLNTWANPAPPPRDDEAQLLEWTLLIPDASCAADASARLSAAGHAVMSSADAWSVRDPWGTRLRVISTAGC